ncbi:MAG: 5S rRNA maturation endonuclease (ribonuclease M5) [Desulforhopalus sp.]|jgi:5S rRNA maturation endonuclease (ribonuclease M5)
MINNSINTLECCLDKTTFYSTGSANLLKEVLPSIPVIHGNLKRESSGSKCGPCPFCGGDDRFVYKIDSERWFCRKCASKGGDLIDYHARINNTNFRGLCDMFLSEVGMSNHSDDAKKTFATIDSERPVNLKKQWGEFGVLNLDCHILKKYADIRGLPIDCFFDGSVSSSVRTGRYLQKECVAFMFKSICGTKYSAIQYATSTEESFSRTLPKRIFGKGHLAREGFFILRSQKFKNSTIVILVESVLDAIAGIKADPSACWIAVGGSNISNQQLGQLKGQLREKTLVVFGDNDAAGRLFAVKVEEFLKSNVHSIIWDEKYYEKADVFDLYRDGELSAIREMIRKSITQVSGLARPLKIVSLNSFLDIEFPPRENLLSPWLQQQGLCMVHAYRGMGKTHFSLGVALAVATGRDFLNFKAEGSYGVLFVDGEMSASHVQERVAQAIQGAEISSDVVFNILTPDLQEYGMPDLTTYEGQTRLSPFIDDSIDLIVLDNLSTLCGSMQENNGDSWQPIQRWILGLRAAGKSVLMVHHDGKGGQQRGTSKKEDILDTVIQLRRPANCPTQEGAVFEVHFTKSRGLHGKDVEPFMASLKISDDGKQFWETKKLEDSIRDKVEMLIADGYSQKETAEELEISKGYVSKILKSPKK